MNEIRAVVGMPQMNAIPAAGNPGDMVQTIVIAVGFGLFVVWKVAGRLSRDKVGYHEDRAREDVIKSLQEERDRAIAEMEKARDEARAAWVYRTGDAAKIAELTVTVKFLTDTVDKLRKEIHTMRDQMAVPEMKKTVEQAKAQQGGV